MPDCTTLSDFSSVFELAVGVNLALSVLNEMTNPQIVQFRTMFSWKRDAWNAMVKEEFERKLLSSLFNIILDDFDNDINELDKQKNGYTMWMFSCATASLGILIYSGFNKSECTDALFIWIAITILFGSPLFCALSAFHKAAEVRRQYEGRLEAAIAPYFQKPSAEIER